MATQVQRRRGTAAETAAFTGAPGELTVDTTDKRVVVHDGATPGGIPMAREDEIPDVTGMLVSSDIGSSVQAYDADTAKLDVDQDWAGAQRSTATTDNDLSFDLAAANNFTCTPSALGTLTFTNIATQAGQTGVIELVNPSAYAISAHANTKKNSTFLATVSAAGTYIISYYCNGTDVYVSTDGAVS